MNKMKLEKSSMSHEGLIRITFTEGSSNANVTHAL